MENEEHAEESTPEEGVVETQHEAHHHARPRLIMGIGAVVVILIIALVIWPKWGEQIKEVCFGDGEVCQVPLPSDNN